MMMSLCLACLTMLFVGRLSGQQPQPPELSWPVGLTVGSSSDASWVEHVVDSPGIRLRVSLPPNWTRVPGNAPGDFVALDVQAGQRLEIAEAKPSAFQLEKPLPTAQLQGSIKTMQGAVPKGYVVEKAGQVRIGNQMWMWHESTIPAFDPSTSTQYQDLLRSAPFGSARTWVFTATPHSQLVRVYCAVLFPRGASAEDANDRTGRAGDVFAGVLQRITFSPR
jgi:hypothetical protein